MNRITLGLIVIISLFVFSSCSTLVDFARGDEEFYFLRGQSKLDVKFDYSNLSVGSFGNEEDYIEEKVEEKNKQEPGSGEEWLKEWKGNREKRYEPEFLKMLNKSIVSDKGLRAGKDQDDAEYLMIVKTTYMDGGFNVGVVRQNAKINLDITFVAKDDPNDVLAQLKMIEVPGRGAMGYDFTTGVRITEAYALAGKELGKYLASKDF